MNYPAYEPLLNAGFEPEQITAVDTQAATMLIAKNEEWGTLYVYSEERNINSILMTKYFIESHYSLKAKLRNHTRKHKGENSYVV